MSRKQSVAVIDYGMGNIFSLENSIRAVGHEPAVVADTYALDQFELAILPGVGAFPDAMGRLTNSGLAKGIRRFCAEGKSLLGICLGMQLLFSSSEELGESRGLGIVDGEVVRFPGFKNYKVPQIQWNKVDIKGAESRLFKGVTMPDYFYFLHSYYARPSHVFEVSASSNYCGIEYCCGFEVGNIFALQFHPEKSGESGLRLLSNFIQSGGKS